MQWLLSRAKGLLTIVVLKGVAQFITAFIPSVYWLVIRDHSLAYFSAASLPLKILIALTVVGPIAVYVTYYLRSPLGTGNFTSRYFNWFQLPIRQVSFDFSNYLGMSGGGDTTDATIHGFQARFKVNWGAIRPVEVFLKSDVSGERVELFVDSGSAGLPASITASSIERIPSGPWFRLGAQLGGVKHQKFLDDFGGFQLFFVYNDYCRRTVKFSLRENRLLVARFVGYCQPKTEPQITLKGQ